MRYLLKNTNFQIALFLTVLPLFLYENLDDKIIVFQRAGLIFVFNFHPTQSYTDYRFEAAPGKYRMVFDSDLPAYGGHGRLLPEQVHFTLSVQTDSAKAALLSLYVPSRTAIVLKQVDGSKKN